MIDAGLNAIEFVDIGSKKFNVTLENKDEILINLT